MPSIETPLLALSYFRATDKTYLTAQEAAAANLSQANEIGWTGQSLGESGFYGVFRTILRFDLSDVPAGANITGVTLKVFGTGLAPDIDFIIYTVEADLSSPVAYTDYANLPGTDFGQFNTTGWNTSGFNTFTINAAGLLYINAALQTGQVELGLRSEEDVNQSPVATANTEYVQYTGTLTGNAPVLTITYTTWPESYPTAFTNPITGKIDLTTYGVIAEYMTNLDIEILDVIDGDGNIDLAVANWVEWTGTSEKIAYDNGTGNVTFTTLEATTAIMLVGDLSSDDISGDMNVSAVDCTVAGDGQFSTAAYQSAQSKITDNEAVFSGVSAPSPIDLDGNLYMDSTSGDLVLKTRDDGQAGVKTDILGDFSAM